MRLKSLMVSKQIWGSLLSAGLAVGAVSAEEAPKIHFDKTVYDVGKVVEGEACSGKFSFRNEGKAVLEIGQVDTSCGCTVASVMPDKLQPGQTGLIAFTLDLTNVRGPTQKGITVPSKDPDTPVVQLTIKADVKPIFEFSPELVFFGEVQPGHAAKSEIRIKRLDGKKLQITKMQTQDFITATVEPDKNSNGQSARILVEAKPEGKPGAFTDMLLVHMDDSPKATIIIPLAGQLLGGIKVEPDALVWDLPDPAHWPGPNPDATTVRTLTVSMLQTNQTLELRDFASDLEDLLVKAATLEAGKKYQVLLKLSQSHKESTEGVLTIETSLPSQPRLEVPVKVNVAKP